ncbi:hypothetical protein EJB05_38019 [Eragrostis curvula]|uniref:FAD-binding domain-containing protein n=1 Tax=Eragrostis curvula TaxID=38414 RepID=A0A5J9TT64_9POAL|nr:hypothetical protein EJB05_38019 [Eragrostis curvula]
MDRKALLQALAEELPPATIRFSSKLVSIDPEPAAGGDSSETVVVRLDDGTAIRAKVLIGCDGVHSVVARWLGMSEPVTSGRSAVRGLSVLPGGHSLKQELRQERSSQHEVTDNLARHMPAEFLDVVRHSDLNNLSWAPLLYQNPWSLLTGTTTSETVTVAGDAFHPMTPDIAQGGCSALEDAIILARALSRTATRAEGMASYVAERRWRVTWMVVGAYLSGWVQQGGTNNGGMLGYMIKWFRDWIFYRFVFPRLSDTM